MKCLRPLGHVSIIWCPRRDSNSHDSRRWLLRPVCLPIPPPGHYLKLVPDVGIELTTYRLQGGCSTTELNRRSPETLQVRNVSQKKNPPAGEPVGLRQGANEGTAPFWLPGRADHTVSCRIKPCQCPYTSINVHQRPRSLVILQPLSPASGCLPCASPEPKHGYLHRRRT